MATENAGGTDQVPAAYTLRIETWQTPRCQPRNSQFPSGSAAPSESPAVGSTESRPVPPSSAKPLRDICHECANRTKD
jgi:hypothetical protein